MKQQLNNKAVVAAFALLAAAAAAGAQFTAVSFAQNEQAAAAPASYTCPMREHADVVSDKPGRCPKCGMNLVPAAVQGVPAVSPTAPDAAAADAHSAHGGQLRPAAEQAAGGGKASVSASGGRQDPTGRTAAAARPVYYCPMHPNYRSDKPGDCPICNMSLVPLEAGEQGAVSSVTGYSTVAIKPERRQLIGLRLGTVERKDVVKTLRAAGRVEASEAGLSAVSLKFSGWVEELMVKATGDAVEVGTPLFSIYSPELLEAQKNYLLALQAQRALPAGTGKETASFAEQSVRSARERLRLWDISGEQLRELESRKEPNPRMKVLSQVKGIVTKRNVVLGSYIESGTDLYEIADLSTVWVYADLYANEISPVRVGQQGILEFASQPNQTFPADVAYIYPYVNEPTRTVRVRFEVKNEDGRLRPGDYGTVSLKLPLGEQVVVDHQAVMNTGERQIAFVDRGEGKLEPREVKLGTQADGLAVVLAGLQPGEVVVTSGNFLVDSESRLKAALAQGAGSTHTH